MYCDTGAITVLYPTDRLSSLRILFAPRQFAPYRLQHGPRQKRFAHQDAMTVAIRETANRVPRQKNHLNITRGEHVGEIENVHPSKIDIEQRQIGRGSFQESESLRDRADGVQDIVSGFLQDRLEVHRDQRFVFDHQNRSVLQTARFRLSTWPARAIGSGAAHAAL